VYENIKSASSLVKLGTCFTASSTILLISIHFLLKNSNLFNKSNFSTFGKGVNNQLSSKSLVKLSENHNCSSHLICLSISIFFETSALLTSCFGTISSTFFQVSFTTDLISGLATILSLGVCGLNLAISFIHNFNHFFHTATHNHTQLHINHNCATDFHLS
jgi:hypothetical protein